MSASHSHCDDTARYWHSALVSDAVFLTAQYYEHEFSPHWHDEFTVPVIEYGAERYRYLGTERVAAAGTVPVVNPGEIHTGSRAADWGWRYRVMYVPCTYMQRLAARIAGHDDGTGAPVPWMPLDAIHDPDLAARVSGAHRLLEANADPLAAETAFVDALSTLIVRHALHRPAPGPLLRDDARVAAMKSRLSGDLTEPLSLSALADAVGLSPFHAARLFTKATGLSPHAWRTQLRLARALAPLRAGAAVADVATAVGFADQSHFTRYFKRAYGVPPGRWQQGR
jgi:AraC-like DNA-binding protein